jgi:molecular chaperone GrpE (heat shock protein)
MDRIHDDIFINESIISAELDEIRKLCESNNSELAHLNEYLSKLPGQQDIVSKLEEYLKIVAECQKETAGLANNQLERHFLYPAIEAVAALTEQIRHLLEQITSLPETERFCPFVRPIINQVRQAAQIADNERNRLDINTIEPKELDDLDVDKHDVKQAVPTSDSTKHKKIERTLVPGLIYRGKVLRQAKVSVYRHNPNQ